MPEFYLGGIEGGATHSKVVICDRNGSIISKVAGPGTNHWVLGIPEVARRIAEMIERAKHQANIEQTAPLRGLGLSLSGCEQDATNQALESELRKNHPNLSESYYVCSDTLGSVFTASPLGGLVLIAGTGSNAFLRNPDGTSYMCGGWGNFLADEGSAWWISYKAIKNVFDDLDNLNKCAYDTATVWEQIKKHFSIEKQHDLLDHCYAKFDKAFFASLCAKLAESAEQGDALSLHLFEEAGRYLAKATLALLPNVSDELLINGNLNVVCVGSVWKSWHLLKAGFTKEIIKAEHAFGLNLLHLTQAMAIGAAYLAADSIQFNLPRNYSQNYEVFQYYGKTTATTTSKSNTNHALTNGVEKLKVNGVSENGTATNGKTATTNGTNKCPSTIVV